MFTVFQLDNTTHTHTAKYKTLKYLIAKDDSVELHDQKSHTDIGKVVQTHTHAHTHTHTYTHSRAGHSISMYITVSIAHLYLWTVLEDIEKLSCFKTLGERPVRGIGIGTTESTVHSHCAHHC